MSPRISGSEEAHRLRRLSLFLAVATASAGLSFSAPRLRSEVIAERSRILRPLETKIQAIEKSVESHDASLRELNGALVKASEAGQGSRVVEVSKAMHQAKKKIDGLLDELQTLTGEHEAKKAEFDAKLRAFDEVEAK